LLYIACFAILEAFPILLARTLAIAFAFSFNLFKYLFFIARRAATKIAINSTYFFLAKVYVPKIAEQ
jgi:hypothetical protein